MKVMVFGTFDHLHDGHRFVLSEAMKRGDVTAIVARDAHVMQIKGHSSSETEDVRRANIAKEFPDVTVELGDEKDFLAPIHRVQPDLVLLGYDQKLPPGVTDADLGTNIERLPGYKPEIYKSSLLKGGIA